MRHPHVELDTVLRKIRAGDGSTWLTRGEASALIASRTLGAYDCESVARNRVGMQLDRAQDPGGDFEKWDLPGFGHGRFTVDTIKRWAEAKFDAVWAGKRAEKYGEQYGKPIDVSDLPFVRRDFGVTVREKARATASARSLRIPGNISECQEGFARMAKALEKLGFRQWL